MYPDQRTVKRLYRVYSTFKGTYLFSVVVISGPRGRRSVPYWRLDVCTFLVLYLVRTRHSGVTVDGDLLVRSLSTGTPETREVPVSHTSCSSLEKRVRVGRGTLPKSGSRNPKYTHGVLSSLWCPVVLCMLLSNCITLLMVFLCTSPVRRPSRRDCPNLSPRDSSSRTSPTKTF